MVSILLVISALQLALVVSADRTQTNQPRLLRTDTASCRLESPDQTATDFFADLRSIKTGADYKQACLRARNQLIKQQKSNSYDSITTGIRSICSDDGFKFAKPFIDLNTAPVRLCGKEFSGFTMQLPDGTFGLFSPDVSKVKEHKISRCAAKIMDKLQEEESRKFKYIHKMSVIRQASTNVAHICGSKYSSFTFDEEGLKKSGKIASKIRHHLCYRAIDKFVKARQDDQYNSEEARKLWIETQLSVHESNIAFEVCGENFRSHAASPDGLFSKYIPDSPLDERPEAIVCHESILAKLENESQTRGRSQYVANRLNSKDNNLMAHCSATKKKLEKLERCLTSERGLLCPAITKSKPGTPEDLFTINRSSIAESCMKKIKKILEEEEKEGKATTINPSSELGKTVEELKKFVGSSNQSICSLERFKLALNERSRIYRKLQAKRQQYILAAGAVLSGIGLALAASMTGGTAIPAISIALMAFHSTNLAVSGTGIAAYKMKERKFAKASPLYRETIYTDDSVGKEDALLDKIGKPISGSILPQQ